MPASKFTKNSTARTGRQIHHIASIFPSGLNRRPGCRLGTRSLLFEPQRILLEFLDVSLEPPLVRLGRRGLCETPRATRQNPASHLPASVKRLLFEAWCPSGSLRRECSIAMVRLEHRGRSASRCLDLSRARSRRKVTKRSLIFC